MFRSPTIYQCSCPQSVFTEAPLISYNLPMLQFTNAVALSSGTEHSRLIDFSSCDFLFDCFHGFLFFEEPSESVSLSSGDTCAGVAFSKENVQKNNVTKRKKELKISTKCSNRVVLTVLDILGRSF